MSMDIVAQNKMILNIGNISVWPLSYNLILHLSMKIQKYFAIMNVRDWMTISQCFFNLNYLG